MKPGRLAILIVAGALVALMVYSMMGVGGWSCEVCIEFNGREQCRTAHGASREEAQRAATDNACAFLAGGMTDSIQCSKTPPRKAECRETD